MILCLIFMCKFAKIELLRDLLKDREFHSGLTVIFQTVLIKKALVAKSALGVPQQDVN